MSEITSPIAGRIRRLAFVISVLGLLCGIGGVALWASELGHGFIVENNRDDSYRNLDFVGHRMGLHNTIRTCAWEAAPVESVVPDFQVNWEDHRVAIEATLQPDVRSSRLVYGLDAECLAPTIMRYTNYLSRELACGNDGNCLTFEHSQMMLRAHTIATKRFSFLDCRDYSGSQTENCSARRLLSEHLQTELGRLRTSGEQSDAVFQETVAGLARSCLVTTGEICREQTQFVRSDWQAAARSPLSALGWCIAIVGLGMLLLGPVIWNGAVRLARWIKG